MIQSEEKSLSTNSEEQGSQATVSETRENSTEPEPKAEKEINQSKSENDETSFPVGIEKLIKNSPFYDEKRYRNNIELLRDYKPIKPLCQKREVEVEEGELKTYRHRCWTGKVEDNDDRLIIWTTLLKVGDIDVFESYRNKDLSCKEEDIDIINKDVPRSLHDIYPDEDEKVSSSISDFFDELT